MHKPRKKETKKAEIQNIQIQNFSNTKKKKKKEKNNFDTRISILPIDGQISIDSAWISTNITRYRSSYNSINSILTYKNYHNFNSTNNYHSFGCYSFLYKRIIFLRTNIAIFWKTMKAVRSRCYTLL